MATAGTSEDENVENRPKTQSGQLNGSQSNDRTMPLAGIGSISLLQGIDSEDEEELEEIETVRASAAQIEKPLKTDDKWKNLTKILKRSESQKEKLAVPRTMRSGNWRPAFVTEETERTERTDEMETDRTKNDDEAVLVQVKDNPEKKRKPRTPKRKYLDIIK
jgi:hypothetical protein